MLLEPCGQKNLSPYAMNATVNPILYKFLKENENFNIYTPSADA
jgi:hypothetical protein